MILQSCAQEPLVDCLGAGSVSTYMGAQIIPGTPLEILGVHSDAAAAREAVRKAGRPGMHINDVAVPLTCAGKMAAINPDWGLRPSDGLLVSQMVELKTDYDQLSHAAQLQSAGLHIVDLMTPLVGGWEAERLVRRSLRLPAIFWVSCSTAPHITSLVICTCWRARTPIGSVYGYTLWEGRRSRATHPS